MKIHSAFMAMLISLTSTIAIAEDTAGDAGSAAAAIEASKAFSAELEAELEALGAQVEGNWTYFAMTDDFTDKDTSGLALSSVEFSGRGQSHPTSISVRCDGKGGYDIFVNVDRFIGAMNGRIPVRYRFGEDKAISELWDESASGKAAFLPRGYKDFRTKLKAGEDFIFEVTDFRGSTSSSKFENSKHSKLDFVMGGCKSDQ